MPEVDIDPKDPLIDEKIVIKITGLSGNQEVTVHCIVKENGARFAAFGCYIATKNGNLDLTKSPSLRGTYSGIDGMGLFWSMKQEPGQNHSLRLIKKDATTPLDFEIRVYLDHLTWNDIYRERPTSVARASVSRWYKAKNVQRIKIRTGQIRGALFIPEGKGPFPGIIDLFGGTGGLIDFRAALLASRGFVALSLAYINYEDITITTNLEYFQEAIDYVLSLPMVINTGVGIVGVSAGATTALLISTYLEKIVAAVLINGPPYSSLDMKFKDEVIKIPSKGGFDMFKAEETEEGVVFKNSYWEFDDSDIYKVWNKDVDILCIVGSDDQCVALDITKALYRIFPAEKKSKIQLLEYQGAGHLIEPPYSPLCRASYVSIYGLTEVWGGYVKEHAFAQEDSWKKILSFLRHTLTNSTKSRL